MLNDVVFNDLVKNSKFNLLKTKVNSSEKKPPDATTCQYNISDYNCFEYKD